MIKNPALNSPYRHPYLEAVPAAHFGIGLIGGSRRSIFPPHIRTRTKSPAQSDQIGRLTQQPEEKSRRRKALGHHRKIVAD